MRVDQEWVGSHSCRGTPTTIQKMDLGGGRKNNVSVIN